MIHRKWVNWVALILLFVFDIFVIRELVFHRVIEEGWLVLIAAVFLNIAIVPLEISLLKSEENNWKLTLASYLLLLTYFVLPFLVACYLISLGSSKSLINQSGK